MADMLHDDPATAHIPVAIIIDGSLAAHQRRSDPVGARSSDASSV